MNGDKTLEEITAEVEKLDQLLQDGIADTTSDAVTAAVKAALEKVGAEPAHNRHQGLIPRLRFFLEYKKQLTDLLDTIRGKPVVLLHGTTSSGKSTLSLRLKSDYTPEKFVEEVIKTTNKINNAGETKKLETDDGSLIEIGSNLPQGTTIIPNIFYIDDNIGESMPVLDMPAVSDQDELHQFVISVVYRLIMQDLRNCVLASLVGARSILMPSYTNGWRDQCLESLHQILGHDLENFKMGVKCVTFIVNHFDQLSKLRRKRLKLPAGLEYSEKKIKVHDKLIDIVARSANAPEDCLALYQQISANFMMVDYAEDEFSDIVGRFREMINPVLERNTVAVNQVGTFSLSGAEEAHRARDILNHLVDMQLAVRHAHDAATTRVKNLMTLYENLVTAKKTAVEYRTIALDDIDNKRFAGLIRRMNSASAPLSDNIAHTGAARDCVALSKERSDVITATDEKIDSFRAEAERAHEGASAVFGEVNRLLQLFETVFSQGGSFGLCGQYLQFMKEHVLHTPASDADNGPVELPTADSSCNSEGGKSDGAKADRMAQALEFTESDFDGIPIGNLPVTKAECENYEHALLAKMKADFARLQQDYNTAASAAIAELHAMIDIPQDAPVLPCSFHQVEGITET